MTSSSRDHSTPGVDFLSVLHGDHASTLHRYGDMASQILDARTWTQKERRKRGRKKRKRERQVKKKSEKKKGKGEGEKEWKVKGR